MIGQEHPSKKQLEILAVPSKYFDRTLSLPGDQLAFRLLMLLTVLPRVVTSMKLIWSWFTSGSVGVCSVLSLVKTEANVWLSRMADSESEQIAQGI